jgi:DNA-binding transcriptional MerR regulator
LCRKADCTPRAVRFYEEKGLLLPVGKTASGRRLYGDEAVSLIRLIHVLQEAGWNLREIGESIELSRSADTRGKELTITLRERVTAVLAAITAKRAMLGDAHAAISRLVAETDRCPKCLSTDCAGCRRLRKLRSFGILETGNEGAATSGRTRRKGEKV